MTLVSSRHMDTQSMINSKTVLVKEEKRLFVATGRRNIFRKNQ
jgi:hypothetical protein